MQQREQAPGTGQPLPEEVQPPAQKRDEAFEEGEFLTFAPAPPPPDRGEKPSRGEHARGAKKRPPAPPASAPSSRQEDGGPPPPDPQQLKNDRVVRLAQVRRRRSARRARFLVGVTLALTLAIAWAVGAFGSSLTALSDLVDTVRIGFMPGGGFPVKTNIPEIYQVEELSGGFVELGSQDLVLYSASGVRLRSIQHNYSRPALAAGRTRFCVYARSGNELRVESRSQTLYTKTTEEALLLCAMSQNGALAVVTRSSRYAAELSVYSPNMEYVYGWNPSDKEGTPCRVAFSEDGRRLVVACLKAQDGRLTTGLYFLDTGSDELTACSQEIGAAPLQLCWLDTSQLLAVYEDQAVLYNALTGAEKYRYVFGGESLLSASVSGKTTALLFSGGTGTSQDHLIILNDRMGVQADVTVAGEASGVVCTRTAAYILEENSVRAYTLEGQEKWTAPTDGKPLALVDAKKLLLFTGVQAEVLEPPAAPDEGRGTSHSAAAVSGDSPPAESAPAASGGSQDTGEPSSGPVESPAPSP